MLDVEQQVCLFHLRRWVGRAIGNLRAHLDPTWYPLLNELVRLIRMLPADGGSRLLALWQQLPKAGAVTHAHTALDTRCQLIAWLHRDWLHYRPTVQHRDVPSTNNGTEQAIGRFKVRSPSMRGITTWGGAETSMVLTSGSAM